MHFSTYKESRIGAKRDNEDRVGVAHAAQCKMLAVCDGMGGIPQGEVAAQFVLEYLLHAFHLCAKPRLRDPSSFLRDSLLAAHEGLRTYAAKHQIDEVPCTTCVVALAQDDQVWFAHVGDSRAYLVRDSEVIARTVDHSYVQYLINEGKISATAAEDHPERHKILNCIGQQRLPFVEVSPPQEIYPADVVLVCTDGLWGNVADGQMARVLCHTDLPTGIGCLMDLAESVAGRACDNVSAVAMACHGEDSVSPNQDTQGDASPVRVTDVDVEIAISLIDAAAAPRKEHK